LLHEITRSEFGIVNSENHQNVDPNAIGDNLKVNVYLTVKKYEGLEFKDKTNKAFMLCTLASGKNLRLTNDILKKHKN
jgi:putative glutamine amidotransferase